jgi:hypothetical protein
MAIYKVHTTSKQVLTCECIYLLVVEQFGQCVYLATIASGILLLDSNSNGVR